MEIKTKTYVKINAPLWRIWWFKWKMRRVTKQSMNAFKQHLIIMETERGAKIRYLYEKAKEYAKEKDETMDEKRKLLIERLIEESREELWSIMDDIEVLEMILVEQVSLHFQAHHL